MRRIGWMAVAALVCALALTGCAQDPGKTVMKDPVLMGKIMDMIAADPATAGSMADRLVGVDTTRTMVIQRLVGTAGGAREVMETVARDQTLMDGALNQAMQDPAMRQHVITLFRGMQMAGVK